MTEIELRPRSDTAVELFLNGMWRGTVLQARTGRWTASVYLFGVSDTADASDLLSREEALLWARRRLGLPGAGEEERVPTKRERRAARRERNMLAERVRGVLWGAAVGDALGCTWEFLEAGRIPQEGTLEVTGGGHFAWRRGEVTDDTDLLLCGAASYRDAGLFAPEEMQRQLLAWLAADPRDVGTQTAKAIRALQAGAALQADEEAQGNGALMRAAVHGAMTEQPLRAARAASLDAALTHPSTLARGVSAGFAALVSRTIWGSARSPAGMLAEVLALADELPELAAAAEHFRPYAAPEARSGGWCVHTLRLALWAVLAAPSYEAGISAVVRTGGDTDTNAAVTGALLGARFGRQGIPQRWRDALRPEVRRRLRLAEVLPLKLADLLCAPERIVNGHLPPHLQPRPDRFGWDEEEAAALFARADEAVRA
jgi:ADP-ribosylglycohydrolase